jgi:phage-related protein
MELASDPAVQNWLGQVAAVLQGVFIVALDAVILALDVLRIAFGLIVDGIKLFAEAMTPIFNYVYPKMVEALNAISALLRGDFSTAWNTIKTLVTGIWSDIKTTVENVVKEISTRVGTFIDETIGKAKDLGRDIVAGITEGINNAKNKVREALMSAIKSGIDAVKSFLGIASPSRMMAQIIGQPIAQGIAAGIVSGVPDIQRALNVAVSSATGAPTQTVQNFYLTANYQTAQSQSSLTADLRAMQLLAGGVA